MRTNGKCHKCDGLSRTRRGCDGANLLRSHSRGVPECPAVNISFECEHILFTNLLYPSHESTGKQREVGDVAQIHKTFFFGRNMSADKDLDIHLDILRLAVEEAKKCIPTPTAFCVGAIITLRMPSEPRPTILATGYSRELPGNTHAEANALEKMRQYSQEQLQRSVPGLTGTVSAETLLAQADIYTTMEPCSVRTSGLAPCADAIIAARLRRCFIGVGEPDDFVKCEGAQRLLNAGIEVIWISGLEKECLEVARRGH